jgi:hypothetical protein
MAIKYLICSGSTACSCIGRGEDLGNESRELGNSTAELPALRMTGTVGQSQGNIASEREVWV